MEYSIKPIFEQHSGKSAYAYAQVDQRICCFLS